MATDVLHHSHGAHEDGHHDAGATKVFGFWIYLMSDCILFATLFATYAVLVNGTAGGPTGQPWNSGSMFWLTRRVMPMKPST